MQLTSIQYDAIMKAIELANDYISNDNFIDYYNNEDGYTNETLAKALDEVEVMIIEANIPF